MAGKGKFIYIYEEDADKRVVISYWGVPSTVFFHFSRPALTTLSYESSQRTQKTYGSSNESNLKTKKAQIRGAKAETIAQLIAKRLNAQKQSQRTRNERRHVAIEDELKYRMQEDNVSELNCRTNAAYKPETAYSVGEEGWTPVQRDFRRNIGRTISQMVTVHELAKENNLSNDEVQAVLKGLEEKARTGLTNTEAFAILQNV